MQTQTDNTPTVQNNARSNNKGDKPEQVLERTLELEQDTVQALVLRQVLEQGTGKSTENKKHTNRQTWLAQQHSTAAKRQRKQHKQRTGAGAGAETGAGAGAG